MAESTRNFADCSWVGQEYLLTNMLLQYLRQGSLIRNSRSNDSKKPKLLQIALTFDDGYLSHYALAKYLAAIRIKATFFVTTHLKKGSFLASYPNKIREMRFLGHEIGSHTCSHPNLLRLSSKAREYELKESRTWLTDVLGEEILSFAYPYFLYNKDLLRETHRYYALSRGARYLYIGRNAFSTFSIRFLTRRNIMATLKESITRTNLNFAVAVLHNMKLRQIVFLLSTLEVLTKSHRIRFVTMSELAENLTCGSFLRRAQ